MNLLKRFLNRLRSTTRQDMDVQTADDDASVGGTGPSPAIKPKISVTHRIAGQSVTFSGRDFPINLSVNVSMVDTANLTPPVPMGAVMTDAAGKFTRTMSIPPTLRSTERIEIQARAEGVLARHQFDNSSQI